VLDRDCSCLLLELLSMPGEVVMSAQTREASRLTSAVARYRLCQSEKAEPVADPAFGHSRELLLARRRASSRSIPYAMCSDATVCSLRRTIKRMAFKQALSISAGL